MKMTIKVGNVSNTRRKERVGASSLKQDEKLYSHPVDKAELINKQFQAVFSSSEEVSREDFSRNYKMPTVESQFPVLDNITLNGITKLRKDLRPNKSPGPDNLGPPLLKELAEGIAYLLLMIFRNSLQQEKSLMIGAPLMLPLPSRKDRSIGLRTTGPFPSPVFAAKSWSM